MLLLYVGQRHVTTFQSPLRVVLGAMLNSISFHGQIGGIAQWQCRSSTTSRESSSIGLKGTVPSQVTCPIRIPGHSSGSGSVRPAYSVDDHLVISILTRKWFLKHPHSRVDRVTIQEEAPGEREALDIDNTRAPEKPSSAAALPQLIGNATQTCTAETRPLDKYKVSKGQGYLSQSEREEDGSADDSENQNGHFSQSNRGQMAPSFFVVRDDLLHPLMGGNKMRKLDAVIPQLHGQGVTEVVRDSPNSLTNQICQIGRISS